MLDYQLTIEEFFFVVFIAAPREVKRMSRIIMIRIFLISTDYSLRQPKLMRFRI